MDQTEAFTSVQPGWKIVTPGAVGWIQLVPADTRRTAIYFLNDTAASAMWVPSGGIFASNGYGPSSPGTLGLQGFTWPIHGPLVAMDWWGYFPFNFGSLAVLEITSNKLPCGSSSSDSGSGGSVPPATLDQGLLDQIQSQISQLISLPSATSQ